MSIQRSDPFREVLSLRDAMNHLLEDSFVRPSTSRSGQAGSGYGFALDIEDNGESYTVRASLLGFNPDDVQVQVVGDTLSISAQYNQEQERNESSYLLRERSMGSLSRTVTLPSRVHAHQAQASFNNGELVLTLPKAEEIRPRQITIDVQGRQEVTGGTVTRTENTGAEGRESLGAEPTTPELHRQQSSGEQH